LARVEQEAAKVNQLESKIVLLHMDIDKLKDENNKMSDQLVAMIDINAPKVAHQKPQGREQISSDLFIKTQMAGKTAENPMALSSRPRGIGSQGASRLSAPLGGLIGLRVPNTHPPTA